MIFGKHLEVHLSVPPTVHNILTHILQYIFHVTLGFIHSVGKPRSYTSDTFRANIEYTFLQRDVVPHTRATVLMLQTYKVILPLLPDCQELRNMAQEPDGESTMNSQIDFADLKWQLCPCGNSDRAHFSYIEEDGEILLRECKKCHNLLGLDNEVLGWLGDTENIRVSLCDCGNENPEAFVFEQLGDDVVSRCGKCRKTKRVSSDGSTEDFGHPLGQTKIDPQFGDGWTRDWMSSLGSTEAVGHPLGQTMTDPQSGEGRETNHVTSDGSTEAGGHPHGQTKIDPKSGDGRTRDWVSIFGSTKAGGQPHGHKKIDPRSGEGGKTKHVTSHGLTEAIGHPCSYTKLDPKSAWKLQPGDHVMWKRHLGYEHHAIVVRCSRFDYTQVRVIHDTSPKRK